MSRKKVWKSLAVTAVIVASGAVSALLAQDAPAAGDGAPPPDDVAASPPAADAAPDPNVKRPALDPFKALVEPSPPPAPITSLVPKVSATAPPAPAIPPVNFVVSAIAGEHPNYMAVIDYEGQSYIVQVGQKVPDEPPHAFEVKAVTDKKVEVFDLKTNRIVVKVIVENN